MTELNLAVWKEMEGDDRRWFDKGWILISPPSDTIHFMESFGL